MASLDDLLRDLENQHRAAAPQPPDNGLDQTLAALQQEYQARPQPTGEKSSQGDRLSSMLQALEQETTANKLKDCEKNHRLYQDINRLIAEQQKQANSPSRKQTSRRSPPLKSKNRPRLNIGVPKPKLGLSN